ncbi:prolipoprotein diacylglyceryl transferase, partial [Amycolatopsis thailandensis]
APETLWSKGVPREGEPGESGESADGEAKAAADGETPKEEAHAEVAAAPDTVRDSAADKATEDPKPDAEK